MAFSLSVALADGYDMWGHMMGFVDFNETSTFGYPMMYGMWNPLMVLGIIFYFALGSFMFSYIFWWTRSLFDRKKRR